MNILFNRIAKIPRLMRNCAPLIILCISASLQAQPSLQITSPADGAVVYSGRPLSVTVAATGAFQVVAVYGQDPLPDAGPLYAPPYQFTIPIPANIASGKYSLSAAGATASGQGAESEITVDVERPDPPVSIKNEMRTIGFSYIGDSDALQVTAEDATSMRGRGDDGYFALRVEAARVTSLEGMQSLAEEKPAALDDAEIPVH